MTYSRHAPPGVLGSELLPKHHRLLADSLLDDPGGLDHGGYELEDGVPPLVGLISIALHKPAQPTFSPCT